jgi:PhnB protein
MSQINDFYPRLVVEGADDAIAFYAKAFGAEVTERHTNGERVQHAMLAAGPARFAVKDAGDGDPAPGAAGGIPVIMALYVDDPDAVAARMLDAGARVIFPVTDHEYGERAGAWPTPGATSGCWRSPSEAESPFPRRRVFVFDAASLRFRHVSRASHQGESCISPG